MTTHCTQSNKVGVVSSYAHLITSGDYDLKITTDSQH